MKTPRKPERPVLWIVAGPNGSGKSSLYNRTDIEGWGGSVWIINPDLLTAKIIDHEQSGMQEANLSAVQRIEAWLEASINTYQTIGVETVLSSPKYLRLVDLAHAQGFIVRMLYVVLDTVELQYDRVAIRVRSGGHDVPREKIAARRQRSFEQLAAFYHKLDDLYIFNNSAAEPTIIAAKSGDALLRFAALPPDLTKALAHVDIQPVHI
ncbi:AAA family ATPase [Blastomonas sp.]|uniref:AAA family ATPase n=1 Tax=Blastomonas sp. TaxID=1909299 RepID=UPI003593A96B